jgi:hypothetical protein
MSERSYGCEEGGGFNALSKAYKADPTIENYLKLRRANPDGEIEVAVIGGIEQLYYLEPEIRKFGLDPQMVASAMDANPTAISELSLLLMERMVEARQLTQAGKTHLVRRGLVIPNKLIDWIITCALDSLSWTDSLEIPRDLIVLIRERLGGSNPEHERGSRAHEQKMNAAIVGGQLKAQGRAPTLKALADALGVAPSTVKRWFAEGELERETDRWSTSFDREGKFLPLVKPRGHALRGK